MADLGAMLGGVGIGGAIAKAVAALEELGRHRHLVRRRTSRRPRSPGRHLLVGTPRSEVAASERRPASITHDAVKVAEAASGGLGTSQPGPPVLSKVQT
jgi:hypothetical protein